MIQLRLYVLVFSCVSRSVASWFDLYVPKHSSDRLYFPVGDSWTSGLRVASHCTGGTNTRSILQPHAAQHSYIEWKSEFTYLLCWLTVNYTALTWILFVSFSLFCSSRGPANQAIYTFLSSLVMIFLNVAGLYCIAIFF